ncbi:MAG TPA: hypothetical protein VG602_02240 [Actinomycetota bacterium]|nr:hypothetical protein [Actinomycetota bacterium]
MSERIVAEFLDPTEASLARSYLLDAGIDARIEGPGEDPLAEGHRWVRLIVPEDFADEASSMLAAGIPGEDYEDGEVLDRRPPMWVVLVAGLVALALIATAIPYSLWPWLLVVGLVAFLLWRTVGPRRPRVPKE